MIWTSSWWLQLSSRYLFSLYRRTVKSRFMFALGLIVWSVILDTHFFLSLYLPGSARWVSIFFSCFPLFRLLCFAPFWSRSSASLKCCFQLSTLLKCRFRFLFYSSSHHIWWRHQSMGLAGRKYFLIRAQPEPFSAGLNSEIIQFEPKRSQFFHFNYVEGSHSRLSEELKPSRKNVDIVIS